ncbi:Gfo/Idh/MocA family protein [Neolewinella antarctica]|uniref:Dehydrogenase n=1 Tax=Neolewinella antarctica TaxID=442734 RepID=A0ABX0XA51_9BACT|nr:Gfo/Idh/MocA family oxidoreductase [Neolewinella antarctica]NJC26139.1 putative dehydrogenase [Neolewinella antarctica]
MSNHPPQSLKFAVVGCGHIGKRHLAVIAAEPTAELVAFCEDDADKLASFTDLYPGTQPYADYQRMLKETDADIISICTPHGLHAIMSIQAAYAGKHILVEKPMALTVRESESMIAAANANEVKLYVVKQNRYNQPILRVKEALDAGQLGRPLMVQCNVIWNRNNAYYEQSSWRGNREFEGGALQTQVSHFIDLMIWWFGDVTQAKTIMDTLNHDIQIEDCGSSALRFSSGVIGNLMWTTCAYRQNFEGSLTLVCEKGLVKIGGKYLNKIEYWEVEGVPQPTLDEEIDQPNNYGTYQGSSSNHDKLITDLVDQFIQRREGVVEGPEGIRSIRAIEKIYGGA